MFRDKDCETVSGALASLADNAQEAYTETHTDTCTDIHTYRQLHIDMVTQTL